LSYTSVEFLAYLACAAAAYRLCPVRARSTLLLILSYLFYCTWDIRAAGLLAGATLFTFFAGKSVGDRPSHHRAELTAFLVVCLLTAYLMFFKIAAVMPGGEWGRVVMPLGLSYYTFKLIGYLVDIHWGKIQPEQRLVAFAAYVAFFPQIVAGPIQRAGDFLEQVPPDRMSIPDGVLRIAWGIFKKLVIADSLAPGVAYVFAHVKDLHGAALLTGFYLYPLQLYVDFSALTDIAIGTGLLFGIRSPENFNRPFTASSISAYWRRWHMSLTTWLTDYVFTPLRMATRYAGKIGLAFSITVNMVAIGLWHGLTWGYFTFGLVHSFYLIVDALSVKRRARFLSVRPKLDSLASGLGCILTFHMVALALVFFRARSVGDAAWLLSHALSHWSSLGADLLQLAAAAGSHALVVGIAGYAILEIAERRRPDLWWRRTRPVVPRWVRWSVQSAVVTFLCVGVAMLLAQPSGPNQHPFLYAIF